MRRLFSILTIAILLFNFIGYQLLIDYMIRQQQAVSTQRVEKETFFEEELLHIKAPIQLPYYNNTPEFEKVYGAAEVDGVLYHYVKRRIWHDTLELLCLPDHAVKALQTAKTDYFKLSLDGSVTPSQKKPATIIKIVLPEYYQEPNEFAADIVTNLPGFTNIAGDASLAAGFHKTAKKPPRFNS